jgi:hypothetical protein
MKNWMLQQLKKMVPVFFLDKGYCLYGLRLKVKHLSYCTPSDAFISVHVWVMPAKLAKTRFISSRMKTFKVQIMMQQGCQLLHVYDIPTNNFDWVGQRFRQQMPCVD